MHIGLIGLGKMGGNMRERLRRGGHTFVGYDRNADLSDSSSLSDMADRLPSPRVVWVMVPAGEITRATIEELGGLLSDGDVVVDGGNSRWTDDKEHAAMLGQDGIGFVDAGVSGGVWGLDNGYALMVGGSDADIAKVQPAFDALKPEGESGFVHAGPVASRPDVFWTVETTVRAAGLRTSPYRVGGRDSGRTFLEYLYGQATSCSRPPTSSRTCPA